MGLRFLRCDTCGNIVVFQEDSGVTPVCCGAKMQQLNFNTVDAAIEKHVPIVLTETEKKPVDNCVGNLNTKLGSCASYVTVHIGTTHHPMDDEHYIQWVTLETNLGIYTRHLEPGDKPEVTFCLCKGETVSNVYAYCNLHGLWKAAK